jgi:chromate transporter
VRRRLVELGVLFFRLGATGFGGPAALIAMMQDEVVVRRKWLTADYFLDLVGATNLVPGPNAVEMAIHIGYILGGLPGLAVAGVSFILPAIVVTTGLAWMYVRYGSLPRVAPFLYGIKPAVLGIIVTALWRLGRTAVRGWRLLAIGLAVVGISFLHVNEIVALLAGGAVGMLWLRLSSSGESPASKGDRGTALRSLAPGIPAWLWRTLAKVGAAVSTSVALATGGVSLWKLGLFFLKVGSVLYGSGYVLIAFIERGLVSDYRWLTQQQLLDAIAAGQLTPGPLSSTATFVGYLLLGVPGAVVATVGMFLPSFVFVLLLNPLMPRFRRSPWAGAFLDAINVSSLGLMAAVTMHIGQETLAAWPTWLIAIATAAASLCWKVNSTWLVVGAALVGWLLMTLVL